MRVVDFSLIRLYSQRLAFLTQQLRNSQTLDSDVGTNPEPWGMTFQRAAAEEYERQLPRDYLAKRCSSFRACQTEMERHITVAQDVSESWVIVCEYLKNLSAALEERLDLSPVIDRGPVAGEDPTTPTRVHFENLASLASPEGLQIQLSAAHQVVNYCTRQRFGGVSEIEISWIRALAGDQSVAQIAHQHGHSERGMHRRMKDLWTKMSVEGKTQAIVVAATVGWLEQRDVPKSLVPGAFEAEQQMPSRLDVSADEV